MISKHSSVLAEIRINRLRQKDNTSMFPGCVFLPCPNVKFKVQKEDDGSLIDCLEQWIDREQIIFVDTTHNELDE